MEEKDKTSFEQKIQMKNKIIQIFIKNLFKITTILLLFLVVILLVFGIRVKNEFENKLKYAEFSNQQLSEQIQILRDEKYTRKLNPPTPIPSPIPTEKLYETPPEIKPFLPKEDLSGSNIYKLECNDQNKIPDYSWLSTLKSKLDSKEEIFQLCNNSELNKAAFMSKIETSPGGMGSPSTHNYYIKIFGINSNQVNTILEGQGSLYGGCGPITNWTKSNNIYYKCGGGAGPWGGYSLSRIDIQTKKDGIVEMCDTFDDQTDCSTYCTNNSDCKSGYFCNLKANNCVKSCTTSDQCLRFVRSGCYKFTDTQRGCW